MKKILDLLEKQIQWIALALGLAFVLYTSWIYLISSPVKVEISGTVLTPGEVEGFISTNAAQPLDSKMNLTTVPPDLKATHDYVADFTGKMDYKSEGPAKPWTNALAYLPPTSSAPVDRTQVAPGPGPSNPNAAVDALPEIAAAKLVGITSGRTNVQLPAPTQPNPNNAAAAAGPPTADKNWVTVTFAIDPNDIVKAYGDAHIPDALQMATFLQVTLERQELQSDGQTWGDATVVPPLTSQQLLPLPPPGQPLNVYSNFIDWAKAHTTDILQPAFYTKVKGDDWLWAGAPVNNAGDNTPVAFDPQQYIDATPDAILKANLTPEQRQQIAAAKAKKKADDIRSKRGSQPRTPTPRPGPGGGGDVNGAPLDPARPNGRTIPLANTPTPPPVDAPDMGEGAQGPGAQSQVANAPPLPQGEFDPRQWATQHPANPTIIGWAHDETALAGHTYRYRVTYKIKNPILGAINVAKNPALTLVLDVTSKPSDWTDKVEVISSINFWVMRSPPPNSSSVAIQVFSWQGGDSKTKKYDAIKFGDPIGGKDGQVDYSTGWTLVAVGTDPHSGDEYVLLMGPDGSIRKRDVRADMTDPNFQKMQKQIDAQNAAAQPAAAAVGGGG